MSTRTNPGRDPEEPRRRSEASAGRPTEASRLEDLDDTLADLAASPALAGCDVRTVAVTEPQPINLRSALADALAHTHDAPSLHALAADATSAVIITSDATRAVPNRELLPLVVAELAAAGVSEERMTVVIGVGAHRPMRNEELREHLGEWATRLRVVNHDPAAHDLVRVGETASGNEILVNGRVWEAGVRVALGQVEPHEFAGFTGGPKAILPAVAGYDSILRNHSLAMLRHPRSRHGVLEDNPIRAEMVQASRLARLDFVVNVVVDRSSRPLAVAAGDPVAVQDELARFIRTYAEVEPPTRCRTTRARTRPRRDRPRTSARREPLPDRQSSGRRRAARRTTDERPRRQPVQRRHRWPRLARAFHGCGRPRRGPRHGWGPTIRSRGITATSWPAFCNAARGWWPAAQR